MFTLIEWLFIFIIVWPLISIAPPQLNKENFLSSNPGLRLQFPHKFISYFKRNMQCAVYLPTKPPQFKRKCACSWSHTNRHSFPVSLLLSPPWHIYFQKLRFLFEHSDISIWWNNHSFHAFRYAHHQFFTLLLGNLSLLIT